MPQDKVENGNSLVGQRHGFTQWLRNKFSCGKRILSPSDMSLWAWEKALKCELLQFKLQLRSGYCVFTNLIWPRIFRYWQTRPIIIDAVGNLTMAGWYSLGVHDAHIQKCPLNCHMLASDRINTDSNIMTECCCQLFAFTGYSTSGLLTYK